MKYRVVIEVLEKYPDTNRYEHKDEQTIDISQFSLNRLITCLNSIKGKRHLARRTEAILK